MNQLIRMPNPVICHPSEAMKVRNRLTNPKDLCHGPARPVQELLAGAQWTIKKELAKLRRVQGADQTLPTQL